MHKLIYTYKIEIGIRYQSWGLKVEIKGTSPGPPEREGEIQYKRKSLILGSPLSREIPYKGKSLIRGN